MRFSNDYFLELLGNVWISDDAFLGAPDPPPHSDTFLKLFNIALINTSRTPDPPLPPEGIIFYVNAPLLQPLPFKTKREHIRSEHIRSANTILIIYLPKKNSNE